VSPERADLVWRAIALHTSPGIATRLTNEIALVHLGAGLDFLGLGLDRVPPQVLEEILERYPRMKFKSEFRNLLVEHCQHNPAAQVLRNMAFLAAREVTDVIRAELGLLKPVTSISLIWPSRTREW
jgi:hypothetical protein